MTRAARHLTAGLPLPDIALPSTHGGQVSPARLPGRNILYVYPWTGRPGVPNPPNWDEIPGAHGSTPEAEGFRDLHERFAGAGISVYGLSGQDTDDQAEFAARLDLPFALLSDATGAFRTALALPVFVTGGVTYLQRLTLVVEEGVLVACHYPVSDPAAHAGELLSAMQL